MPRFTPEQWREAFGLLDTALDLSDAAREAWLAELERSQPHLQPALRDLLALHAKHETGGFLQGPPQFRHAPLLAIARTRYALALLESGDVSGARQALERALQEHSASYSL
jgi:hypothetical protein